VRSTTTLLLENEITNALQFLSIVPQPPGGRSGKRHCGAASFAYFSSLKTGQTTQYLVRSTNHLALGNGSDNKVGLGSGVKLLTPFIKSVETLAPLLLKIGARSPS
jgi:hypothetical protein